MKRFISIFFFFFLLIELNGQNVTETLVGKVSFISSQNVYVKFKSTAGISAGDTLFISEGDKLMPVLVVTSLSSVSCLCRAVSDQNIPLDHIVIARIKTKKPDSSSIMPASVAAGSAVRNSQSDTLSQPAVKSKNKQAIEGSISEYSYSDFSNTEVPTSQRFRITLSLKAANISGSKFSVESHISFRYKSGEWETVKNDLFSALKIYNLAVRYDFNRSTSLSIGRRINPRISSMGTMDGIQFEKSINKFSFGILAGSRPDYQNYGVDFSLFQYGGYLALNTGKAGKRSESSVAYIEQTNNFKTDRRFIYFQHSNTFVKNLNFLGTVELDLFKLENDVPKSTLDLTGTYLSLSYRISRKISISGSYDARKNIIYYETYKTYVDRILEDELRQGYRLYGNWRIAKNMVIGLQSGYRFLKSDPHPSRNIYGYFTYTSIPGVNLSATVSATYLESNFVNSKIAGLNLLKDFPGGKIQAGLGYHFVDNQLPENKTEVIQHIGELNLYWLFAQKMSFSVNYEGTFEAVNSYNRIYLQLRRRF